MANENLVQYVRKALANHKDLLHLHAELTRFGWSESDIEQAILQAKQSPLKTEDEPYVLIEQVIRYPLKPWLSAVVLAAFGLFIAVAFSYQRGDASSQTAGIRGPLRQANTNAEFGVIDETKSILEELQATSTDF